MARRKRMNTLDEDILGMGRSSMLISTGSMMVGVPALNAPTGIKQAFPTAAGFMPVMGIGMMGKHIIGMTEQIKKKRR